ncbi:MAG: cation acetate symporter [Chloroherpetonaceae bacterium]|nr:cation acetate symporter [Chloroherpetonaceae bacterium]
MKLRNIFTLYTAGFAALVIIVGLLEAAGVLQLQGISWIFMGFSVLVYAMIGFITRTSDPSEYYVAGRGVNSIYNGMATGSDWMSAASFISMAGLLFALGHAGLAYIMGWTGGYVLLALLLAPYLRKFGQYTIPDFLGARYEGNLARTIGIICAIVVSFTYLTAQLTGVGLIVSRFIGLPQDVGIYVGLAGVLVCSFLGGMRAVTWTQVAQYIVLIIAYLIPVIVLSTVIFKVPLPQLTYGQVLQSITVMENQIAGRENPNLASIPEERLNKRIDPEKEKETRALWANDVKVLTARLSNPDSALQAMRAEIDARLAALAPEAIAAKKSALEKEKADLSALLAAAAQPIDEAKRAELTTRLAAIDKELAALTPEAVAKAKEKAEKDKAALPKDVEDAKTKWNAALTTAKAQATPPKPYLAIPEGIGMVNFLGLIFCLMLGTAGLPHILTRYYTTPSVKQARSSVAWSLFFIFLLYFTAPAYAAFAKYEVFINLVGTPIAELPSWIARWKIVGLFDVVDKNGDGIVQFADFVVKSTDFVVLATPEIAGLPGTITGLVMAGGLAAALSTADGLLLTISNAISHDLYYKIINPQASVSARVWISKILLVLIALGAATFAAFVKLPVIANTVAWAFSYAASSIFPALVLGIWWRRTTAAGAIAGMIVGLVISIYYSFAHFNGAANWFGIDNRSAGLFGVPAAFLVMIVVSLLTPEPNKKLQEFVYSVRFPKGAMKGKEVEAIGAKA